MKHKTLLLIQPLVLSIIIVLHFIPVNADLSLGSTTIKPFPENQKTNLIAVEYSKSCQTMLDNNASTSCPTLDKIWKYDTTNKQISGKLALSNGKFYRTMPEVRNHYIWYGNTTICIDCFAQLSTDLTRMIFIEPSDFTYVDKNQILKNAINFTTHNGVYISPDCALATIGYSDFILNDTIHFMKNNCTGPHYSGNQTTILKPVPFQYNNPFSTLHYQAQIQHMKTIPVKNCIIHRCDQVDPYKNKRW